jgi:hypothetical protein
LERTGVSHSSWSCVESLAVVAAFFVMQSIKGLP